MLSNTFTVSEFVEILYVNLLPPWYFKITLSYIIPVLVLEQGDVFACRFEIVTNQGAINFKQVIDYHI
jgi:hypothetical protein